MARSVCVACSRPPPPQAARQDAAIAGCAIVALSNRVGILGQRGVIFFRVCEGDPAPSPAATWSRSNLHHPPEGRFFQAAAERGASSGSTCTTTLSGGLLQAPSVRAILVLLEPSGDFGGRARLWSLGSA